MWINNSGDYITNTQFVEDYPADPRPSNITSIWRTNEFINHGYPFIPLMIDLPNLSRITFEQFVADLFSTSSDFDSDFKTKIKLITDKQVQEFVQTLLKFFSTHSSKENPDYYLESEIGEGGFFDFIQNNDDIDINNFPNGYWNESIQTMVDYFNQHFDESAVESTINYKNNSIVQNGKIPTNGEKSFNTEDIKNADAGFLFGKITDEVWTQLVKPWYNIDWDSYYKVRGRVDNFSANSQKNLTFTRTQNSQLEENIDKWIRLLMPNNSRRVAVEDLNRNFWVISSTLQAVCAYLWGSNAPIPFLMKNILNELAQLWENIMFLWAGFNLISQKGGRGIKTIIMPLPRTDIQPYRKYDDYISGFPSTTVAGQAEFVIERLMPIIQKYKYTNLCILPYTRNDNYYSSYYKIETYRGVVFYNCRTEKISYVPFEVEMDGRTGESVYFNPANVANNLYAARETETYYKWSYPVSNIKNIIDNDGNSYSSKRFYGAYRIIPEIEVGYSGEELCIKRLKLTAIDAVAKSLFDTERKMVSYTLRAPIKESSNTAIFDGLWEENDGESLGNFNIYDGIVKQAYYLGELPSCTVLSKNRPFFVYSDGVRIVGEGKLIKIGNYLPQKLYTDGYYNNSAFYGEQITPNGRGTTDYLLNLTITGSSNKAAVKSIYEDHYGSDHVVPSNKCFFFKPRIEVNNNTPQYSLICSEETAAGMTTEKYRTVGIGVISDYITKVSTPDTITYYIAGVGIQPWHNKPQNDTFQGYWTTTMLTHMFRFVPNAYEKYISREELNVGTPIYDMNDEKVGTLEVLGVIDKREAAFSIDGGNPLDTFSLENNRTTWRLPQLIPEKKAQGYIILKEQATQEYYFVDPDLSPELKTIYDNAGGGEQGERAVVDAINNNYATYADQLLTEDNFRFELQNPSGRWCVFDGNTSYAYDNNKKGDVYVKQSNRREVAYTTFTYSDGKFVLSSPTQGRKLNIRNWSDCKASYILPNGGFNDMKFSW